VLVSKPRILLDLDGVIVDYDKAACKAHGLTVEAVNKHRYMGEWSLVRPLGIALGIEHFTIDAFWEPIHALGPEFWQGLELLDHARELLALVDEYASEWYIVTSPCGRTNSYVGKYKWIKNFFGQQFKNFEITSHKFLMANPTTILIDDHDEGINKFHEAGGLAIVFPRAWNSQHYYADNPLNYVKGGLSLITKE
jgi:5'(3')-deoxyribonucleotidase